MIPEHALWDALRAALLLGLALLSMPLLGRASAATRRLVLGLALGGALFMPLCSALAPAWRVPASSALAAPRGVPELEPLVGAGQAPSVAAPLAGVDTAAPPRSRPSLGGGAAAAIALVWAL